MSFYSTTTAFAAPAANDTALHLKCSATVRAGLCEATIGSNAAPVEQSGDYRIVRTTTAGTTPVATPAIEKHSEFSPASGIGATAEGNGYTTEPTVGDTMLHLPLHQKATHRFVAYPGREIWSIVAANNGIGLVVIAQSAAFAINASLVWME